MWGLLPAEAKNRLFSKKLSVLLIQGWVFVYEQKGYIPSAGIGFIKLVKGCKELLQPIVQDVNFSFVEIIGLNCWPSYYRKYNFCSVKWRFREGGRWDFHDIRMSLDSFRPKTSGIFNGQCSKIDWSTNYQQYKKWPHQSFNWIRFCANE